MLSRRQHAQSFIPPRILLSFGSKISLEFICRCPGLFWNGLSPLLSVWLCSLTREIFRIARCKANSVLGLIFLSSRFCTWSMACTLHYLLLFWVLCPLRVPSVMNSSSSVRWYKWWRWGQEEVPVGLNQKPASLVLISHLALFKTNKQAFNLYCYWFLYFFSS